VSFVKFAGVDQIPPGRSKSLRIGLRRIAVFNVAGTYYAIEDACAHMKAPLSTGRLQGLELTCTWHGWKYDLATGKRKGKESACVRTFAVKIEKDTVFVDPTVSDSLGVRDEEAECAEDEFPRLA